MFKVKDASYLNPNLFILNVRKGFSQNSREHIDQIVKITKTHYEYINSDGKNYTCSLSSLFENFTVYGFSSQEEIDYFKSNISFSLADRAYSEIINSEELSGALKTALYFSFERSKEDINFRQKFITAVQLFIDGKGIITHEELGDRLYRISQT